MARPRKILTPETREVLGMRFLPALEPAGPSIRGERRFQQARLCGQLLWELPGGLICRERDLERVARALARGR